MGTNWECCTPKCIERVKKRGAGNMSHVSITSATYRVVARDGSCIRCGSQTGTHVSGGKTGEAAGETEPGWAGPLVPDKCCGSEIASLGLP